MSFLWPPCEEPMPIQSQCCGAKVTVRCGGQDLHISSVGLITKTAHAHSEGGSISMQATATRNQTSHINTASRSAHARWNTASGTMASSRVSAHATGAKASNDPSPGGQGAHSASQSSLFEDLSIAQVSAGALAAVTSMLLASRIGIAGSVIGVAVGSVVSAVASQVYKKFFEASASKIRSIGSADETLRMPAVEQSKTAAITRPLVANETVAMSTSQIQQAVDQYRINDSTTAAGARYAQGGAKRRSSRAETPAKAKKAGVKAIVVSVVAALIAVAISAFVIDAVTMGEGVGTKPAATPVVQLGQTSDKSADASSSETVVAETSESTAAAESTESGQSSTSASTSESVAAESSTTNSSAATSVDSATDATSSEVVSSQQTATENTAASETSSTTSEESLETSSSTTDSSGEASSADAGVTADAA